MSQQFSTNDDNIDSDAQSERRRSFIERMERKLEYKKSITDPRYQ